MTSPAIPDKKLAKDVATQLDRRRRRRKLIFFALWAALMIAAILYVRCGRNWGLGGGTSSDTSSDMGSQTAVAIDAGPARCTVRVSAEGITVDGTQRTRDEAVAACKQTDGAMVTVTGDARQGDWEELRAALQAVGVKIYIRGELWDGREDPAAPEPPPGP